MEVSIKKWGNSASVRIPVAVMKAARLNIDEPVDVREEGGRIVIEPVVPRKRVSLSSLLKGITSKNRHKQSDFGSPVGKEIL